MILEALPELEDAPWSHLKEQLSDHSLARRLHDYGIKSDKLRPHGQNQCKGYRLADLEDAWRRYLPSRRLQNTVTSVTSVTSETFQGVACDALPGSGTHKREMIRHMPGQESRKIRCRDGCDGRDASFRGREGHSRKRPIVADKG